MLNKGVNSKSTYLTKQIGNAGVVKINLNKNEGGLFLDIPLIITPGYDKVNLNLHFSSFSNEYFIFGTGFQLNLYKKFTESDNKLIVKDSFGALIEFDYYGLEDGMEVYKNDDFQYIITKDDSYYTLKDIDGSAITYYVSNSSLESVKHKSRYLIRSGTTTSFYVFGNYSLLITISEGSTLFDTIQLMNGNTVVKEVRITYLNDYISSISYYSLNEENNLELLSTNYYEFSSGRIKIKDGLSQYYTEFLSSNNFLHITQINEGYDTIEPYKSTNITFLDSLDNTTRVSTVYNNYEYFTDYIYNSNELLKTIINNFGLSQSFVYDDNKNIIQKSKIMSNTYADEHEKSVICDYFASMNSISWKKSDSSQVNIITDTNRYSNLIGDKSLIISSSDTVYYYRDYSAIGKIGEYYTLKIWSKRFSGTDDLHLKIIISSSNQTQELEYTLNSDEYGIDLIQFKTNIKLHYKNFD